MHTHMTSIEYLHVYVYMCMNNQVHGALWILYTTMSSPILPPQPPVSAAKMANSPVNKEEEPPSPHSAWSPIRRRPVPEGEAIYQCTKRGYRN